jgi:O-antigen/teichoic acid export membrane protein
MNPGQFFSFSLVSRLNNDKVMYILINVFISMLGFVRSFFMMKFFDFYDLGLLTILQTVIMFLGFFQLGLLNGGYRLFCLNDGKINKDVNDTINTFLLILTLISVVLCFLALIIDRVSDNVDILFIGVLIGILSISKNWITNVLIATVKLKDLNFLNVVTSFLSLLLVFLIPVIGYWGAVLSLIITPIFFVGFALYKYPDLRPTRIFFELKFVKYILTFGFIPFVAGIFTLVNTQIERWSITELLGVESLGKYYLAFFISGIFIIIPSSLNSLFFPQAMNAYHIKDKSRFDRIIKNHFFFLSIYTILVLILIFSLLKFFVLFFFPKHIIGLPFVYAILPGLIAIIFTDPLSLLFNATVKLKPILWGNFISVGLTVLFIATLYGLKQFNLFTLSLAKSVISLQVLIVYLIGFVQVRKLIWRSI